MTFREIDQAMLDLVDEEGEILDIAAFTALQMERDAKVENMALWVLDLRDEADSIQKEIDRLRERKLAVEAKAKRLRQYIPVVAGGAKIKTALVSVYYSQTESVQFENEAAIIDWAQQTGRDSDLLHYAKPEVSKTAVRKLIKDGFRVPGATIVSQTNTIIR